MGSIGPDENLCVLISKVELEFLRRLKMNWLMCVKVHVLLLLDGYYSLLMRF